MIGPEILFKYLDDLLKRNPREKWENKNPGLNYNEMIINKIEEKIRKELIREHDYFAKGRQFYKQFEDEEKEQTIKLIKSKKLRNTLKRKVGRKIRKFRKLKKRTQKEFGKKCKLNRSYIIGLEKGKHNISLSKLRDISKVLNIYTYELFESKEEKLVNIPLKKSEEENNICENFGERLKILRERNNFTQKELAEYSTLNRAYIAKIESGKGNITLKNILKLAIALDIDISTFFDPNFLFLEIISIHDCCTRDFGTPSNEWPRRNRSADTSLDNS